MNVNVVYQGVKGIYPDALFAARGETSTNGSHGSHREAIEGLRDIIMLSMHCLDIMLRRGHIQRTFDGDSLVQDSDPYIEGLLNMIRKEKVVKG
jgi:hypothetical protein